jgi:radical SAM/Cys-rich protein
MQKTLMRREHDLADPARQRARLAELDITAFEERAGGPLIAGRAETLQINVGRRCNQVCAHCHVDAGPDRTEVMSDEVLEACLALLESGAFGVLDITGGAPELHPRFTEMVERAAASGAQVMHRCNLTAIRLPAYRHLPELFAKHRVQIIASLPALAQACTDSQRGDGVYDASLESLRELNELGYAREGTGLILDLVSNPIGAALPAHQDELEVQYRTQLRDEFGIEFNRLLTITNMPISRFLEWLDEKDKVEPYMSMLVDAFNPGAAGAVMCRTTISVGSDGRVFDCDFNQMLDVRADAPSILELPATEFMDRLEGRKIRTGAHCYGCTAGAGSGCQGAIT